MTHTQKLEAIYRGTLALHAALSTDTIHPLKQLHACIGFVTALERDLNEYLHLNGMQQPTREVLLRDIVNMASV